MAAFCSSLSAALVLVLNLSVNVPNPAAALSKELFTSDVTSVSPTQSKQDEKFILVTDLVLKKLGPRMREVRLEQ